MATEFVPDRELIDGENRWFVYSPKQTGLTLVCLEDLKTSIVLTTPLANPEKRTAAHIAWAGARQSRAPGPPWVIMHEMGERGVDPDQKLDDMFTHYGHKSVGDMARLTMSTYGMPMHVCLALFNNVALNGGQEKSSRYQDKFGQSTLHPIRHYLPDGFPVDDLMSVENKYQHLGSVALHHYGSYKEEIVRAFNEFFKPESSREQAALDSRAMDCVRFFLPLGTCSGLSLDTSARDWSRVISEMRASPLPLYRRIGLQIERLFSPTQEVEEVLGFKAEAPTLIRHSEPDPQTNNNLITLHRYVEHETGFLRSVSVNREFMGQVTQNVKLLPSYYSEGAKMVAQYLSTIWPGATTYSLLDWLMRQDNGVKEKMSQIIFTGHDHNHELPLWAGTTGMTLIMEGFLGELRDWNRHRAHRRFAPLPLVFGERWSADTAHQIMARGFGLPLYLTEVEQFAALGESFGSSLASYYRELNKFVEGMERKYGDTIDYSFVVNLLPLAHQMDLWMHGDPKQASYLTNLRVRPGGHINYRYMAYRAHELVARSDQFLSGLKLSDRPDPANRKEFFDRG